MALYEYKERWPAVTERRQRVRDLMNSPVKYRYSEIAALLGAGISTIKNDIAVIRAQDARD